VVCRTICKMITTLVCVPWQTHTTMYVLFWSYYVKRCNENRNGEGHMQPLDARIRYQWDNGRYCVVLSCLTHSCPLTPLVQSVAMGFLDFLIHDHWYVLLNILTQFVLECYCIRFVWLIGRGEILFHFWTWWSQLMQRYRLEVNWCVE
jgi:hypothetical protein